MWAAVDNKLVGLPAVADPEWPGCPPKRRRCPCLGTQKPWEKSYSVRLTPFPVEVIVGLTDRVRQRPVGAGGDHPGISIHDGINTGQFPVIVQGNGDIGLRLRIEVDDRLCVAPPPGGVQLGSSARARVSSTRNSGGRFMEKSSFF